MKKPLKEPLKERIRIKLLKIGRKNQVCRVLVLPVLMFWVSLFQGIAFLKGNGKRLTVVAMSFLLFVVYSSFSFPLFITADGSSQGMLEMGIADSNVSLAEEEEVNISAVELLDDADVLGEYDYTERTEEENIGDTYDADSILKYTEGREPREDKDERTDSESVADAPVFSKDDWKLLLINKQHSVPEEYTFELGNITDTMRCDERIIDDLRDMLQAAKRDKVNLDVRSPYRDIARQEYLFNRKITLYMNQGMSFVEAFKLSGQVVTYPGASEHQIGLALDIVSDKYASLDKGFGDTKAGKWLLENSYRYGFILRYPEGKEYITGIEYEPWHFRYVGVDAATVIMQNGITLEEFWEELE